jgi:hypothetical protein
LQAAVAAPTAEKKAAPALGRPVELESDNTIDITTSGYLQNDPSLALTMEIEYRIDYSQAPTSLFTYWD